MWCELGLDQEQFWSLTPRLIVLSIEARLELQHREDSQRVWAVWHIAALSKAKKLPSLKKMMPRPPKSRRREAQTPEAQEAILKMFTAAFGGTIKEKSK